MGDVRNLPKRACAHCGREFQPLRRTTAMCSRRCRKQHWDKRKRAARVEPVTRVQGRPQRAEHAAEIEAQLAHAVRMETAMPWERHPQPWTNVVARGEG
jgi:uncharacterized OB-fold protein